MSNTPRKTRSMTSDTSSITESKEISQKEPKQKTPAKNGTQKKEPKAKANNKINSIFSPTSSFENIRITNSRLIPQAEEANNLLVLDGSLEAPPRNPTGKYEISNRIREIGTEKNPLKMDEGSDIPIGALSPTEKAGPPAEEKKNTDLEAKMDNGL